MVERNSVDFLTIKLAIESVVVAELLAQSQRLVVLPSDSFKLSEQAYVRVFELGY